MNEVMVSIRMPSSLADELKTISKKNHFLDVSEEVRSIIRDRFLESQDPYLYEIKKLRQDIKHQIEDATKKRVISELNEIKKNITR